MQTLHSTCGLHVRSIESRLRNILLLFCVSICCGQSGLTYGALVTFHHHELDPDGGHTQIADINGDGKNDVVIHHTDHLAWLPNPNYQKRLIQEGRFSGDHFALADLDRDGDLDIVSIAWRGYQYLHVWRNDQ